MPRPRIETIRIEMIRIEMIRSEFAVDSRAYTDLPCLEQEADATKEPRSSESPLGWQKGHAIPSLREPLSC